MRYSVIYVDPPWFYAQRCDTDSMRGGACKQYDLMPDAELIAFGSQIDEWADEDCALAMWATGPRMDFACDLLRAWRFRYATMLAVWVKIDASGKPVTACGHYTSQSAEYLLLGLRGSMPVAERLIPNVIHAPRGAHSEKPQVFRTLVESLWPDARRLEVFCRHAPAGWDAWGNQVGLLEGDTKQIEAWRADGQLRLFATERDGAE